MKIQREETGKIDRRGFLKLSGAAALLLTGAGGVFRAVDQGVFSVGKGVAYEPWTIGDSEQLSKGGPIELLRYAVLAASAHNTQPWLFRLKDDQIDVFADLSRNIGVMDPLYREMNISLGCALENLCLAAQAYGYQADVMYIGDSNETTMVAQLRLGRSQAAVTELFRMIPKRHTNRGAYDSSKSIPESILKELISRLHAEFPMVKLLWHTEPEEKKRLGSWIIQATEAIIQDREQARDSHRWYRQDWAQVNHSKDGTTVDATG